MVVDWMDGWRHEGVKWLGPRLVLAGFGSLHGVTSNQRTVVFYLYLVKIVQILTN
jgi:hypothetical protein